MAAGRRWKTAIGAAAALLALAMTPVPTGSAAGVPPECTDAVIADGGGKLPDIRTVVPQHLNLVNQQQREILRFSNLIANTGDGPWRLRPEFPLNDPSQPQRAIQQVLNSRDSSGAVVCEDEVSEFVYHPTHRHWHTKGIATFELHIGGPDGPLFQNDEGVVAGFKTTFCLIDWVKLQGSSTSGKNTSRVYFDCFGPYHGVSVGWTDQYHHATDDQDIDITGVVAGQEYTLVSTTDKDGVFWEKNKANNTASQGFIVTRDSKGNPKITLTTPSFCEPNTGLCGEQKANR
jgi:hypothetical protein